MHTPAADAPQYLYKIVSMENWEKSLEKEALVLSSDDDAFIHFSKEEQLERILKKYWADVPEYVILKVESRSLNGVLVYETNPGGEAKYYHLYEGSIPKDAIIESKLCGSCPVIPSG